MPKQIIHNGSFITTVTSHDNNFFLKMKCFFGFIYTQQQATAIKNFNHC